MDENIRKFFLKLTSQISILLAMFCIIVGTFILVDFLRFSQLEEPTKLFLEDLRLEVSKNPDDKNIKDLYTNLELVYRRAYFVNDAQIQEGSAILLFAVGFLLLSLAIKAYLSKTLPIAPQENSIQKHEDLFLKTLAGLVCVALVMSGIYLFKIYSFKEVKEVLGYSTQADLDSNWTGLRGSRNDGTSRAFTLPQNPKISKDWEAELDISGYNSAVIYDNQIYISGEKNNARVVSSFNLETGEKLWENSLTENIDTHYDDQTGPAPSTMVCDAFRAYAIFPSGELVVYGNDGKLLWKKKFDLPAINYGYASSLLLTPKALIIQMSLDETNTIYALDPANGNQLWQTSNDVVSASWSSPSFVNIDDKEIIITLTSAEVIALDLSDGKILWKNECLGGEVAPSITYANSKLFVANENVSAFALDILTGEILWENSSVVLPSISSIAVDENAMYIYSSGGTLSRLSVKDGTTISEVDTDEGFNSSPIIVGDRVVAFDLIGKMFITKTNSDIAESVFDLEESVNATPAFKNDKIVIRLDSKLVCLKVQEGE